MEFYLKSDCLNPPNIVRRCLLLSEHVLADKQKAYLIEVSPAFESAILDPSSFSCVVLGMVSESWNISRIGEPDFMVDIYFPKDFPLEYRVESRNVKRLGMGIVLK